MCRNHHRRRRRVLLLIYNDDRCYRSYWSQSLLWASFYYSLIAMMLTNSISESHFEGKCMYVCMCYLNTAISLTTSHVSCLARTRIRTIVTNNSPSSSAYVCMQAYQSTTPAAPYRTSALPLLNVMTGENFPGSFSYITPMIPIAASG